VRAISAGRRGTWLGSALLEEGEGTTSAGIAERKATWPLTALSQKSAVDAARKAT